MSNKSGNWPTSCGYRRSNWGEPQSQFTSRQSVSAQRYRQVQNRKLPRTQPSARCVDVLD